MNEKEGSKMTIGQIANAINEGQRYVNDLHDFAEGASREDRMLAPSEANHLAAVLQNLINFVSNTETP